METGEIKKTGTVSTILHKTSEGENMYARFGYVPMKICNHIRGKVSGSINAYPINIIHTSKKSTKEGLNEEPKWDFISR